jgi:hypothetical protein
MAKADWQFVKEILDEMKSQSNAERAKVIVKKLGKRIRQRRRDSEDVNQAAARVVREATERI